MSLMPTLLKRTSCILVSICLIGGCGTRDNHASLTPIQSTCESVDSITLFDWRIKGAQGINIYNADGELVLIAMPDTYVSLTQYSQCINGNYYQQLANNSLDLPNNTTYYIDLNQEGLYAVDDWKVDRPHLIPTGQTVISNDSFELKDINGNIKYEGKVSLTLDVITVESDRIGIYFQDQLLYIDQNQLNQSVEMVDTRCNPNHISVLMYHFFYDPTNESSQDGNDLNIVTFENQMAYLNENNIVTLTMQQLYHYLTGSGIVPKQSVVITIDDGDESVARLAKPVVQKYQLNATLFVIGGWFGESLPFEFVEMAQDGIELQSHSFLMHQGGCSGMGHGGRLLCVDKQEGIDDTIQSLNYVDNGFVYCYPFGDVNDHAVQILRESGVKMAFTTQGGQVSMGDDLYHLPRIRISESNDMNYFVQSISNE